MIARLVTIATIAILALSSFSMVAAEEVFLTRFFLWGPASPLSRVSNQLTTHVEDTRSCKYSTTNDATNHRLANDELFFAAYYSHQTPGSCSEAGIKRDIEAIINEVGPDVKYTFISFIPIEYNIDDEDPCPSCPSADGECTKDDECLTLTCANNKCSDVFNPEYYNSAMLLSSQFAVVAVVITIVLSMLF